MSGGMFIKIRFVLFIFLILALCSCATSIRRNKGMSVETTLLTMPIGEADWKNRFVEIQPGDIYQASSGLKISFDEMIDELSKKRVIFLGESHTSMKIHGSQDQIIRALYKKNPEITIGMEFFKREHNAVLKEWSEGRLTEEELMYKTGWYTGGGYNFGYYRPFIRFAREKGLTVEGMNIPRTVLRNVSRNGLDNLSKKEKAMVGDVVVNNAEHKQLIMKYFDGAMMGHGDKKMMQTMLDNRYAAQCVWDNVFSDSILEKADNSNGIYIVIVGSGHISYKLGANRRLKEKSDIAQVSVFPVEVDKNNKGKKVSRAIGDYIIGFEKNSKPFYPELGVRASDKNNKVIVGMLFPDSASIKAGFKTGDHIISLDGVNLKDITQMKILLSKKKWGEKAVYKVSREGREIEIIRTFETS